MNAGDNTISARIARAKLYVDAHFAENIELKHIARQAYVSSFHFIRLFKRMYRRTPYQYLTAVRLERAKELLHAGRPVSDVCYSVGFESLSSFTGLFKRKVGRTPSSYRDGQRALRADMARNPMKFVPGCFADRYGVAKKSILEKGRGDSLRIMKSPTAKEKRR